MARSSCQIRPFTNVEIIANMPNIYTETILQVTITPLPGKNNIFLFCKYKLK